MPRHIPALIACVSLGLAGPVAAQVPERSPFVTKTASASSGRIRGVVRDDAGALVAGANIVAMGTTLAMAQSDGQGRFSLPLPVGEYVLRASRAGYLSLYREPVRVQTSVQLERNITLIRLDGATAQRTVVAAVGGAAAGQVARGPDAAPDDHSHSEPAWRLRHLTRTILRDSGTGAITTESKTAASDFGLQPSLFDWVVAGPARAAASFFGSTDFDGQVNFLTTSIISEATNGRPDGWSRGVAYLAVGAPVGSYGDWRLRGAMTPGNLSSWVLLGEYESREERTHAFTIGMSFGAQGDLLPRAGRSVVAGTRSVGAFYAFDRWRVRDGFDLEYGLRTDRYDYVAAQDLLSPRVGTRLRVMPRTFLTVHASQRVTGPGANEFLPPSTSGPWLPPERTFSTLVRDAPFRTEQVQHVSVGLSHQIGRSGRRTVSIERFRQVAENQISTLFGLDRRRGAGHYYVATAGGVEIDGWQFGVEGHLIPHVDGAVHYITSDARWQPGADARAVRWLVPSASRTTERLHDLAMNLDAGFPGTATAVSMAYRLSSGFTRPRRESREPALGGRFDVEIRQGLPYQPIRGGRLELVLAVRNLFTDRSSLGSIYDELLTLSPPTRIMGGVQVRF